MVYAQDLSSNGTILTRSCQEEDGSIVEKSRTMDQYSGPVLLIDGDRLQLSPALSIDFHELRSSTEDHSDCVINRELEARPNSVAE